MIRHVLPTLLAGALLAIAPAMALAQTATAGSIQQVVSGLDEPWGLAHLPGGGLLITEIDGRVLLMSEGRITSVSGGPVVEEGGQGGLLDVTVPRDFATSREIFFTYSKAQGRGAGTALAVAQLSADGARLEGLRDLFESAPGSSGGRHFGSRVVEAADGTLFLTIGDRGDDASAQDRSLHNGSIIRINRDGSVPRDNPFVGQPGVQPEIWSYGHRNPQGAGFDASGTLWTAEHGARGGDEVNRIAKGANYGWPIISYGTEYSGRKIGEGTRKAGLEQPLHHWDPSIAPSGLLVYSGEMFPELQGDIFVGALKFDYISRLEIAGDTVLEAEQIKTGETRRVRDIVEAPDGSIWFISVGNGAIYRIGR